MALKVNGKIITVESPNDRFQFKIDSSINPNQIHSLFVAGNIGILEANGKKIYLHIEVNGDVKYKFSITDKEFYTTTKTKLGIVLTQHFGFVIEVYNNVQELLKKRINLVSGLSKAITNNEKYIEFKGVSEHYKSQNKKMNKDEEKSEVEKIVLNLLDEPDNSNETPIQVYSHKSPYQPEMLNESIITLSTYQLEAHKQTSCIYIDQIPIAYKKESRPDIKQVFYKDEDGLNCVNNYVPSKNLTKFCFKNMDNKSITMLYILYMVKNDITNATYIIVWLVRNIIYGEKLPYVLALISEDDKCMKIFYEKILMPNLNPDYCEKIECNDLDKKSLSKNLNEKVLYNFHNITIPTILNAPAMDLTERLIYQNEQKLNSQTITTRANILLTSTCNYLPLIGGNIQSLDIDVESNIYKFCEEQNIYPNPNNLIKLLKDDTENFIWYLQSIDISKLNCDHNLSYRSSSVDILDGKEDPLKAFDIFVRIKHINLFSSLQFTNPDLHRILKDNFNEGRIARPYLLKYFESVFGKYIYKNNSELIEALKTLSDDKHPFDNEKISQSGKMVYYSL